MKKLLLTVLIILLIPTCALAAPPAGDPVPAGITVLANGQPLPLAQSPVVADGVFMLPLRDIAESLKITVKWDGRYPDQVILSKGGEDLWIQPGSKEANYGSREWKVFYIERSPILVNGRLMVSPRFITEVLGADLTWDENRETVNITDNGRFLELPPSGEVEGEITDRYYRWYHVILGAGVCGPDLEEARKYVLKQGLLVDVDGVEVTYNRFAEYMGSNTMVSGIDENGREKLVWLGTYPYILETFVTATAFKDEGLSREKVLAILREKGLDDANIKKLYISPHDRDTINWMVVVELGGQQYGWCVDFYTGTVTSLFHRPVDVNHP